jgi:hypothetical protein
VHSHSAAPAHDRPYRGVCLAKCAALWKAGDGELARQCDEKKEDASLKQGRTMAGKKLGLAAGKAVRQGESDER